MRIKLCGTILICSLIVLNIANAQTTNDGMQAAQRKDYATALEIFRKQAEKGDGAAMRGLAIMYGNGNGVEKNLLESSYWAIKSAEAGDVYGMGMAGFALLNGVGGIKKDESRGIDYLRQSASKGNAIATQYLGIAYFLGIGVLLDYAKARELFEKSSIANYAHSNYYLGRIFDDGLGISTDKSRALAEYKMALSKVKPNEVDNSLPNKPLLKAAIEERIRILEASGVTTSSSKSNTATQASGNEQAQHQGSTLNQLDEAKKKCDALGFKQKSEAFGECVIKLIR